MGGPYFTRVSEGRVVFMLSIGMLFAEQKPSGCDTAAVFDILRTIHIFFPFSLPPAMFQTLQC